MIKNVNIVLKELKQNLINILLGLKKIRKIFKVLLFLTLFKMGIFEAAHGVGGRGKKATLSKTYDTSYNDETWQLYLT